MQHSQMSSWSDSHTDIVVDVEQLLKDTRTKDLTCVDIGCLGVPKAVAQSIAPFRAILLHRCSVHINKPCMRALLRIEACPSLCRVQ